MGHEAEHRGLFLLGCVNADSHDDLGGVRLTAAGGAVPFVNGVQEHRSQQRHPPIGPVNGGLNRWLVGWVRDPAEAVLPSPTRSAEEGQRFKAENYGHGLGADACLYTRAAVVAAGRTEFDSVLPDPSAFTPYARDLIWAEPLLYTPDRAYRRITGKQWDRETRYSYESCSNTESWAD